LRAVGGLVGRTRRFGNVSFDRVNYWYSVGSIARALHESARKQRVSSAAFHPCVDRPLGPRSCQTVAIYPEFHFSKLYRLKFYFWVILPVLSLRTVSYAPNSPGVLVVTGMMADSCKYALLFHSRPHLSTREVLVYRIGRDRCYPPSSAKILSR
jgi:hypothetical protein